MGKRKQIDEHYTLKPILKEGAHYNLIFGERSNGKTYSVLSYIIEQYATRGEQGALLRRMQEDFTGKRGSSLFNPLTENGEISRVTNGEYDVIPFHQNKDNIYLLYYPA